MLLALLTRKHILLVGPRGTAKSLLLRLLTSAIDGARYWELLFGKFTTYEQVFGPVSVKGLQEDSYRRVTSGKLPEAHLAFADEIFKSNNAIQNSMLTAINERLFHNDGQPEKIPLEVFMGASNEIPTDETLAAFYDRFVLRFVLKYIAEPSHFVAMLGGPKAFDDFATRVTVRLTLDEVHAAQDEVKSVKVPEPVLEAMATVRQTLANQGVQPSDRRYNESVSLIQAKAWMQGRNEAIMDDLSVLTNVLWDDPAHKGLVQGVVLELANPLLKQAEEQHDAFQVAWANLQKVEVGKERTMGAVEVLSKINTSLKKLAEIKAEGEKSAMDMTLVDQYIAAGESIRMRVQGDYLGLFDKKR